MATEHTTGIVGSQKGRQASATAGRTAHRGTIKKVTPKVVIALALILPLLLWWRSDDVQNEVTKIAVSKTAPEATRLPRVVAEEIVLPAGGTLIVKKAKRCHVDNISDKLMGDVGRVSEVSSVRFTSRHTAPVVAKIWFFDEGGNCSSDYQKLASEHAFM